MPPICAAALANHGSYSPDGSWVVFESVDISDPNNKGYDIYIMKNEAGNAPIQVEAIAELRCGLATPGFPIKTIDS